jgi:hypothetical protein
LFETPLKVDKTTGFEEQAYSAFISCCCSSSVAGANGLTYRLLRDFAFATLPVV